MIFNPEIYQQILSDKLNNFAKVSNDGFNQLNKLEDVNFSSEEVKMLHYLKTRNIPFSPEDFTEENYNEQKRIEDEEIDRLRKLLDGTYLPYEPTQEDLQLLVVTIDDINQALMTKEQHLNLLNEINGKI